MTYTKHNLFSSTAPAMPTVTEGTKFVDFILSKASKDMRKPLFPMIIPTLASFTTESQFVYSNGVSYELCGQIAHLIAPSGTGKAQLGYLVEQICRDFRKHDDEETKLYRKAA